MMFPHRHIHKYTFTSLDEKTQKQIDHILIDRRWHYIMLDVRSFRGADFYWSLSGGWKVRERWPVSKQVAQKFDGERFNLRNLNEPEVRKQCQIEIINRFAALKNLSDDEDINRTWENIKDKIKTSTKESLGLHELKQHKPWFDEECVGFFFRSTETD